MKLEGFCKERIFMKLCYRGVSYDYNPPQVKVAEGPVAGKYRGANWHSTILIDNPVPQIAATLTYRGVTYHTQGQAAQAVPQAAAAQAAPNRRKAATEVAQAHHSSVVKTLERRLQVAYNKGDQHLINLLEAEWKQFA
jgi:Domain of unknown function (DUF4278)